MTAATPRAALVMAALLIERAAQRRWHRREKEQRTAQAADEARRLVEASLPAARQLYERMKRATGGQSQKVNLEGLPRPLRWLIGELLKAIAKVTGDLSRNVLGVNIWLPEMRKLLAQYGAAAWMAGQGSPDVSDNGLALLGDRVGAQLEFLDNFAVEVAEAPEFEQGFIERAASYAHGIKQPYWEGKTDLLPLPAMPGQGTQCGQRCNCAWDVKVLDRDAGDYDAYWRLEPGSEHCQTCLQRADEWAPVRIRKFELQD